MAGPPGQTAQYDRFRGAVLRPWQESLIHEGRLQDPGLPQEHPFSVPVLVKRTQQERVDSLTRRLVGAHPVQQAALLQEIAVGYWKQGMPVTVEALRKAASQILNQVDNKVRLSNQQEAKRD